MRDSDSRTEVLKVCQGSGPKKKTAKEEAARRMLAWMDSAGCWVGRAESSTEDDIPSHEEILKENQYYSLVSLTEQESLVSLREKQHREAVSRLQVLCSREGRGRPQPSYQDLPTPPVGRFSIQCSLGSLRTEGRGSSKEIFLQIWKILFHFVQKLAKQAAAAQMMRLKAQLQPKTNTKITLEPKPASILPMTKSSPTRIVVRPRSALTKLGNMNFHSSQDWWGLLAAVSREVGFSVTKIEERCEEGGRSLLQTLVQCTTEPVLGN